jgi:hypothetical protein
MRAPCSKVTVHFHGREHEVLIDIEIDSTLGVELGVAIDDMAPEFGQSVQESVYHRVTWVKGCLLKHLMNECSTGASTSVHRQRVIQV